MSKKVLIVMGSDSDLPLMEACMARLDAFEIAWEAVICSAHRSPERAADLATYAAERGFGVIIAAAGLAAHLPGVLAAYTTLPVIGVPLAAGSLQGVDALLAEVQMPTGIPVATVAINGADNAAILSAQILALSDADLQQKLVAFKIELSEGVYAKNQRLQEKLNNR
ncbi:MAG TPA: 5-(carboxyamino)imidazole ribonucleotide mutase [Clostridiaceae bacterium]|nr:5-(carboxyamino)imidazole ribonucleotide mutase [Clostridiaceae bacterium]